MQQARWSADELRDASVRQPAAFAKLLQQALVCDFSSAFRYVKTQKLILRARSITWIKELEVELEDWLPHAPLKGKLKAQLRHHLEICEAIQKLLDVVDQQSASLRIWEASTEGLVRALFAWVQEQEALSDELKPSSKFSDSVSALTFMEYQRKALRSACDYAIRILSQIGICGIRENGTVEVQSSDIRDAAAIACLADLALHVLDCYTYKSYRVSVKNKSIQLHALKSQVEQAATWSTLRSGSRTFVETIGSPSRIEDVKRFASGLNVACDSFTEFLECDAGCQILRKLDNVCKDHNRILRRDVEELIDLDLILRLGSGEFPVDLLLDCWSLLYRLALCAHTWGSVLQKKAAPIVPEHQLLSIIANYLGLGVDEAGKILSQFTLTPGARHQDPFFRPLIMLNSRERLIAAPFIETGRFARNIFTIAIREGGVDFAAKGLKPLRTLLKEFRNAGYEALINVPVSTLDGTITDVGIAATKNGFLFVGQTKVLIHPDTIYDDWKVLENLGKAACQLDRSLSHVSLVATRLGLSAGEYLVVPFLLTNVWDFTGATVGGFKIIDFSYLSFLLRGAELWKLMPQPVPTREVLKIILGKYPTGEELSRLLRKSIHEDMFQKPELDHYTVEIGEWTLTIPIDLAKRPGLAENAVRQLASQSPASHPFPPASKH
jgi:hypothetical protein